MANPIQVIGYFIRHRQALRSPEDYAVVLRKNTADPFIATLISRAQQAGAFPQEPDNGWRYDFTRLPMHDKLCEYYSLDKIAGQGSAFERSLRIMDWLCAHTYYSGISVQSWLLGAWASTSLALRLAYGGPFRRSVNCIHKAAILSDCLLAAGVVAMPCFIVHGGFKHRVVHVWLPEESRWVMLDPSFNSYIIDNEGRVLHLIEIQRKHRAGEAMHVAQYHLNGTQDCREIYLDGFILNCLLEIEVYNGTGSKRKGPRNRLVPEGVEPRDAKLRAITTMELLAPPNSI